MWLFGVFDAPVRDKAGKGRCEGGEGNDGDRVLGDEPEKHDADRGDDLTAAYSCHGRDRLEKHQRKDASDFDRVDGECMFVLTLLINADVYPVFR
jgi:hypothetical protein